MNLFEIIDEKRKEIGMNQGEISKKLKVHDGHLWRSIKDGKIKVSLFLKICKILNLELIVVDPEENTEQQIQ